MPKSYGRNERIAAELRREAAQILSAEIKDPRVNLATVTEVNVAPDLRNATIFVSFLVSTLASRLKLRYMPNIHFEYDRLVKDSMRLDALIAKGLGQKRTEGTLADALKQAEPAEEDK